jgi:drug/metabolite transporter (DMT)-like permease
MVWLIFALSGPVLWGASNVLDSTLRRHYIKNDWALTWLTAAARLPFALVFLFLGGWVLPHWTTLLWMGIGGALWTIPFIFYYKAMETEDPSRVSVFIQLVPAFTLLNAFFILQEKLTPSQGISFGLLISAGLLASLKTIGGKWRWSGAFAWLALSCFLWSLSDIFFKKFEPAFANFHSAFAVYFLGSFIVAGLLAFHPRKLKKTVSHFIHMPRRAWLIFWADEIMGVSGSILFAYALTLGKASLTSAMAGVQPLSTFFVGLGLFHLMKDISREDVTKNALILKLASFALVIAGLAYLGI